MINRHIELSKLEGGVLLFPKADELTFISNTDFYVKYYNAINLYEKPVLIPLGCEGCKELPAISLQGNKLYGVFQMHRTIPFYRWYIMNFPIKIHYAFVPVIDFDWNVSNKSHLKNIILHGQRKYVNQAVVSPILEYSEIKIVLLIFRNKKVWSPLDALLGNKNRSNRIKYLDVFDEQVNAYVDLLKILE